MTRVSVDKAALDDFIKSFRSTTADLGAEFASPSAAEEWASVETNRVVAALDIKELDQ